MMTELKSIKIHTVTFGDMIVPEDKIISFKDGLPGFPHIHKFAIIEQDEWKPFQHLQALGDLPIALLIVNPFLLHPAYEFQLSRADMEDIQSSDSKDVMVFAVATIPENAEDATLNLMAPIVINGASRLGKQVILHESGYGVRHPLFKTAKTTAKSE